MNWWLGLLGVAVVFTGWGLRRLRTPQPVGAAPLDPELPDDPELDATLTAAERELRELSSAAVVALLEPVVRRAAPLRGIRRAPTTGATRLQFADGTVVLVRSQGGQLAILAIRLQHESIVLVGCQPMGRGAELEFSTSRGTVTALAVGLDQAD